MEKRNVLPKSKAPPPPEPSEEETASSEEETEDDEQTYEGSGLDSGSAESADASKKKPVALHNPKQQSAGKAASTVKAVKAVKAASTAAATSKAPSTTAKAANSTAAAARAASPTAAAAAAAKASNTTAASAKAANTAAVTAKAASTAADAKAATTSAAAKRADTAVAPTPGKRLRETNGKKDKPTKDVEEEPSKKRKKTEVATPAPKVLPKVVEQSEKKVSSRAGNGKSIQPSKEKKQDAEEETKKPSSKRKPKSSGAADVDTLRAEDEASQKPKMTARPWTPEEEMALSKEVQKDRINGVYGSSLPSSKSDPYWENLVGRCPFMLQYDEDLRIERLREKVRRMRLRYEDLDKRHKAGETIVYRKPHEKDLWPIWKAIWGPIKVDGNDEEEEEDEDGEEDESEDNGSDEDEEGEATEEERPPAENSKDVQKKNSKDVQKKKVAGGLSTDEDEGSPIVPCVPESVVPTVSDALPTLTDDLRAENLALLRDMKSTCLKMVDEARTQSLFIAEKILSDTRVKTIEMLDEGKEKSLAIMEELRILAERVNSASLGLAAQGSGPGASSSSGDPSRKEISVKWDSQKEAEDMLMLQRLQLVQDEARMYQEAILRKLRSAQPAQLAQQD